MTEGHVIDLSGIEKKIGNYAESNLRTASQVHERTQGSGKAAKNARVARENQVIRESIHEALKILSATIR